MAGASSAATALRFCALLLAVLGSCILLASCGGASGDVTEIEAVIQEAWSSTDPSICTELATQHFDEQITQTKGPAAIEACEESAGEGSDESATPTQIEVSGSHADLALAVTGGQFDGQTLGIALVKEEGRWRLNEISGFVRLRRLKLLKAFLAYVATRLDQVPTAAGRCFVRALGRSSKEDLERVSFGGSPEPLRELYEQCSANGTLSVG